MSSHHSWGYSLKGWRPSSSSMSYSLAAAEDTRDTTKDIKSVRCVQTRHCGNRIPCWRFRNPHDGALCCVVVLALSSLLFAATVPILLANLLNSGINEAVVIDSPSSPSYEVWQSNMPGSAGQNTAVYYDIYFFDVQNAPQVLRGAKPILVERGPYSYKEYFTKFDVSWQDDGNVMTYNKQTMYEFDAERSLPGVSENDTLTLASPTALALEYLLGTVPVNASVLLEYLLESKLASASSSIDASLEAAYAKVDAVPDRLLPQKQAILAEISAIETSADALFDAVSAFVAQSSPTALLMKLLLGQTPQGVSPFFQTKPSPAYFGWLNDSILLEVQSVLDLLPVEKFGKIPWTSAVPGATVNWTSIEDRRRRRGPDVLLTGKRDASEVAQYVTSQNMRQSYGCISPMASQDPLAYKEGQDFPACEIFNPEWNKTTAAENGYRLAWGSDAANAIRGTNGEMFGRPVRGPSLDMFVSDIFRTIPMEKASSNNDWYGVTLDRWQIPDAELANSTANPAHAQFFSDGPSGLVNLTAATNAPSFASYPHFFAGAASLVSEVVGLSPNSDTHITYMDIEPNTGLLARAHKALQSNFLLNAYSFPTCNDLSLQLVQLCANASALLATLNGKNITDIAIPACNLTEASAVLRLMAADTDWAVRTNPSSGEAQVYVPFAWVRESTVGSQADAQGIKDSVYFVQDLGRGVFLWGMVTFGVLLAVAVGMLATRRMMGWEERSSAGPSQLGRQEKSSLGKLSVLYDEGEGEEGKEGGRNSHSKTDTLSQSLLH